MTIVMSKKLVFSIMILIWIVFSLAYILNDVWSDFKVNQINTAYQQGRVDTINTLIQQAETSCQPIPVSSGEKQIQVINAACPTE